MHLKHRGKNAIVFIFIFLMLGLITTNPLFYAAGIAIAIILFFDLVSFLIAVDAFDSYAIRNISKNRMFQDNFLDVKMELKIKAKNLKNIYFKDVYPDAFTLVSGDVTRKIDAGSSYHNICYRLCAIKRGTHSFSESYIHLGSNFHMFEHSMTLESRAEVSIYPPVLSKRSILAQYISSLYGSGKSKQKGMGIEVANIRNYMLGDDFKRIDWKTSLRLNSMFTREFESDIGLPVFVLVDHSKTSNPDSNLGNAVRMANYLIQQAEGNDQPVGLLTFTHDRITNQTLIKKGKKRFEISRNLFSLEQKESKPYAMAMDMGEIKAFGQKLSSSKDEFFSLLAPFFVENSEHLKAMEKQGIYQAIKRVINFSKTPSMICIITERYDAPLIESIRLATYYGNKVLLIATSSVMFRAYDVLELEGHYQEYMRFQKKIEKFKRLKGVKVVEACPGDKPEQIINQAVYRWKTHY
ncbi:MAG: DUF58 domain-containing protein [Candidatus Methanoperedens sp.]|nr:DUF58 domain-containing protein [Candidatus Methanoperedens sp.]MCZ7395485.1 DUF58 domain-containing protein [Candidatus Methanoperedens sp.]